MGRTNPVRRATTMFKCAGCHRDLPNPPARLVVAATFTMSVCERCASVRFEALQPGSGGEPPKSAEEATNG